MFYICNYNNKNCNPEKIQKIRNLSDLPYALLSLCRVRVLKKKVRFEPSKNVRFGTLKQRKEGLDNQFSCTIKKIKKMDYF